MTSLAHTPRMPKIRTRVRSWVDLQELPKHLANILPFLLGTAIAFWESSAVNWATFGVALLALFLLTDGTYIAN